MCIQQAISDTISEELEVVENRWPTPALPNLRHVKTKHFVDTLNPDIYNKMIWLCSSETMCKLFFWPWPFFINEILLGITGSMVILI
jgi:hypothetical protein